MNLKLLCLLLGLYSVASQVLAESFPCTLVASEELATLRSTGALVEVRETNDSNPVFGIDEPQKGKDCYVSGNQGVMKGPLVSVSDTLSPGAQKKISEKFAERREQAQQAEKTPEKETSYLSGADFECVGFLLPSFALNESRVPQVSLQFSACVGIRFNRLLFLSTNELNLLGVAIVPLKAKQQFDRVAELLEIDSKR